MLQEARERPHREEAVKSVQRARCSVCHVLIRESDSNVYVINVQRHTRMCLACHEEEERWQRSS